VSCVKGGTEDHTLLRIPDAEPGVPWLGVGQNQWEVYPIDTFVNSNASDVRLTLNAKTGGAIP
jgi:hypothetical protein